MAAPAEDFGPKAGDPPDAAAKTPPVRAAAGAHRAGSPPRRPESTLPSGVERASPNDGARRLVAGGPIDEDVAAGKDDPELQALRDAERVLFPKPLKGIRSGWSWELPGPADDRPAVSATGLPSEPPVAESVNAGARVGEKTGAAIEADWLRRLTMPNLPVRLDARVIKYLGFYRDDPRGKRIARVWAKKSGRYVPAIKAELARAGLPTDLVWLSLIESGHNPAIFSPAGAAGLWQFIPESGRMYGLVVDRWVDERLDPQRATQAAIRYLSDLHRRFGTWELAMAGYNMGHGGLMRSVRKYNTNDFWALSRYEAGVPWETALYVPKILAIAIVMNNRKAFGIGDVLPDPPLSFDTVHVGEGVPLSEVARAAGVAEEEIKELNRHFLASRTPPPDKSAKGSRQWAVRVPAGRGAKAARLLAKGKGRGASFEPYVIRFGDTLERIAALRKTTERQLRNLNEIRKDEMLPAGTVLLVPPLPEGQASGAAEEDEVVFVPARRFEHPGRRRVFYRVLHGDTLQGVALAFGVTPSELVAWNALDDLANLQQGMVLQLFVDEEADLASVHFLEERSVRVLEVGSDEFYDYFESLGGRKRILVTARDGETLAAIGKRYGMSGGMMERINHYSRRKKLSSGEKVIVYAKSGAAQGHPLVSEVRGAELPPVEAPEPDVLPAPAADGGSVARGALSKRSPAKQDPAGEGSVEGGAADEGHVAD